MMRRIKIQPPKSMHAKHYQSLWCDAGVAGGQSKGEREGGVGEGAFGCMCQAQVVKEKEEFVLSIAMKSFYILCFSRCSLLTYLRQIVARKFKFRTREVSLWRFKSGSMVCGADEFPREIREKSKVGFSQVATLRNTWERGITLGRAISFRE